MNSDKLSKPYFLSVLSLTLILPALSVFIELLVNRSSLTASLAGTWFIFWAVGMRLFIAGLKQTIDPSFTAKTIFHIDNKESLVIIRELGFANICFGIIGIMSLFLSEWRIVSAFGSGIFYGIAGVNHLIKKPAGANEMIALISDIFIFLCLAAYVMLTFTHTPL